MPTPASEEERIICTSDDCDQTGEYRNDYLRGLYCLTCHENIMENYYDDDDSDNDDDDDNESEES